MTLAQRSTGRSAGGRSAGRGIVAALARRLRRERESGMVLVVVLLVVLLLAALLLEFNYEARLGAVAADNHYRSRQALRIAESGVAVAKAALRASTEGEEDSDALRQLLGGETTFPLDNGRCRIQVASENGKININRLDSVEGRAARWRIDQFLRLIDLLNRQYAEAAPLSYAIVPSIIDWVDPDDEVTRLPFVERENEGAESDYYRSLDPPYEAKNAPFDAVEELLLVRGVTPEIYWGAQDGGGVDGGERVLGLCEFVTVYGDGRIDINSAPPLVLWSLAENMPEEAASQIVDEREREPFQQVDDLLAVPAMTREVFNAIRPYITVEPARPYYRVMAEGEIHGVRRRIEVVLRQDRGNGAFTEVRRREW